MNPPGHFLFKIQLSGPLAYRLNGLEIERHSIAVHISTELPVSYVHRTQVCRDTVTYTALRYCLRTDLGGCKIPKFSKGAAPSPP